MTEDWKKEMSVIASTSGNENTGAFEQKIQNLDGKLRAIKKVTDLKNRVSSLAEEIEQPSLAILKGRDTLIQKWKFKEELQTTTYHVEEKIENIEGNELEIVESANSTVDETTSNTQDVTDEALHVASVVKDVPGFLETAEYLREKAGRLEGQEFTVALFGAFSAGKSSFSNALIGENVLPVSPNPTTADINRIRPVSAGKEDRTADVVLKTRDRMTEDVVRSFEALGIETQIAEDAYEKADDAIGAQNYQMKDFIFIKHLLLHLKKDIQFIRRCAWNCNKNGARRVCEVRC